MPLTGDPGPGTGPVNNPARVPPAVEAVEPNQAGLPRIIRPIGAPRMRVGAPDPIPREEPTMFDQSDWYEVPNDVTALSVDGRDSMQFRKGERIPAEVAARFGLGAAEAAAEATAEEPAEESAEEPEARSLGAAPQNRARKAAPQNR